MTQVEFEVLYEQYKKPWLDLIRALVKNEDTAQDVLQSAIMRLLAQKGGLGRVQLNENPDSWIRMWIVWHIKEYVWGLSKPEDFKPKKTIALGELGLSLRAPDEYVEEIETPQEQGVRAALGRLDITDQDIVLLRIVAGMTFPEIKATLQLKCAWRNVQARHVKALVKLKAELGNVGISDLTFAGNRRHERDQSVA